MIHGEVDMRKTIFNTAKYILEKQGRTSTFKLQKLCYYAQAWHMVWHDTELFDEDFEAWVNGPVCPALFAPCKGKFAVTAEEIPGDSSLLSEEEKGTIDSVIDYYAPHDAQWLSRLTHLEDPWIIGRGDLPIGTPSHNPITKASMAEYYGNL